MGQTHAHRYMRPLLEKVSNGDIDPSEIITHRMKLEQAPEAYKIFANKEDRCIKVVLRP
jgi:threonine dehydrogenase-like Zn-dependent dehydrogenase